MGDRKKTWRKADFLRAWNDIGPKFAKRKGDAAGIWAAFHLEMEVECLKSTNEKLNENILSARLARSRDLLMEQGILAPAYPSRPKALKQTTADVAESLGFKKATAAQLKAWRAEKES